MLVFVYLYVGTGNPCAGQNRVRSSSRPRSYQAFFASLENLGFLVATGSDCVMKENEAELRSRLSIVLPTILILMFVPIRWYREPLRGTKQGQVLPSNAVVPSQLRVARELGFLRGDWL
jgi:hypothetical protein